jgi:hypothetical protein
VLRGHDELATVVERIGRYERTFHHLGQMAVERLDEAVAHAEIYCIAHHWRSVDPPGGHMVAYVRYEDRYRRLTGGEWCIASRVVHIDGVQTSAAGSA